MARLNMCLFENLPYVGDESGLCHLFAGKVNAHEQGAIRRRLPLPLTELLPGLARVVFMQNFSSPALFQAEDAETAADQLGMDVKLLDVRGEADL